MIKSFERYICTYIYKHQGVQSNERKTLNYVTDIQMKNEKIKILIYYCYFKYKQLLYLRVIVVILMEGGKIQGKIMNKDLEALSDQLDKVTQQMSDRLTARSLETIVINMQDLTSRRVKPLLKQQDTLLYKLAALELQIQPLQRQINESLTRLKTIQYYIDNQGDKIAQLKTKIYIDRLANYLDQWRFHVLSEMGNGAAKCRPLWDVIEGIKLLLCNHFLGNLSGYWFATFLCIVIMVASTPTAHILSLVYKKLPTVIKDTSLLSTGSEVPPPPPPEANEGENWHTPEPPPPPPQEGWQ